MLQAGFARVDITPPLGCPVDGYFKDRRAKGYLDLLELNALAVSDGESRVVMIAADMLGVMMEDVAVIKELIGARTGLDNEHIVISALHQHTSLFLKHQTARNLPEEYVKILYRKFADVAQMALADMSDAVLYTGQRVTEHPLGFVRRYYMNNGKVATNPSSDKMPLITGRCDDSDDTVRVLRFKREGVKDIALVNFSTHPDVIGGEYYSADWPGFARRFVESDHLGVSCIFFTGAQGDSNHIDFFKPKEERLVGGNGYTHSRFMGRTVADAVAAVWEDLTPHADGKVDAAMTTIYNRSNTSGEEKYDECKAMYKAYYDGTLDYKPTGEQLAFARRVIHIRENMSIYRQLPITAVKISDVVIVGFAGEPFTDYAREVRRVAGDKFALTFCLTNGYQGYLPTAKAFAEGGYEAANSHFTSTLQEQAIAAAEELLKQISD